MSQVPKILWNASLEGKQDSILCRYISWLEKNKGLCFEGYDHLWQWSVDYLEDFWKSFVEFAGIFEFDASEKVLSDWDKDFIGVKWFERVQLNYAELVFRNEYENQNAILFMNEQGEKVELKWFQLKTSVAKMARWMRMNGLKKGDRVVSLMPNIPETVIAFLAAQSIGAIWSSCSPDFGSPSIKERFQQIEPSFIFFTDGYQYNGKPFHCLDRWEHLVSELGTIKRSILLPYLDSNAYLKSCVLWHDIMALEADELYFEPLPFNHPIWILYSSGTTGLPKAIVHTVGGNVIEHLKVLMLHWDLQKGERFFWHTTTGWMMWNFSLSSLMAGATLVLYDGSPSYPDKNRLWNFSKDMNVTHMGLGAAFIINCMKEGLKFHKNDFPYLRTIGATGSPLTGEGFDWVYEKVKKDVWLISFSGGTDVCSGFVGGNILKPVHRGEIQCRLLGSSVEALDENGLSVRDQVGEMVIQKPMPSMPVFFWNDPQNAIYRSSYFEKYPGNWWHGDFLEVTSRNTITISGRSDATLNRYGVRIGTSEIYSILDRIEELSDSLIVCVEKDNGSFFMPLFIVLNANYQFTDSLKQKIIHDLRIYGSPRHVPDIILEVAEIPYTINGKKMETPVKKILMGADPKKVVSRDAMKNPSAIDFFIQYIIQDI